MIRSVVYDNTLNISTSSTIVTFSLPANFGFSMGCYIRKAWLRDTWTGSPVVCILYDYTRVSNTGNPEGKVTLGTNVAQQYILILDLLWRIAAN